MTLVERLTEALGDGFRNRAGDGLASLLTGLTAGLKESDDRLDATARGWAKAFDLDESPEPKWIGTATGTRVPGGLTLAEQRDYVRDRPRRRRGTPGAIREAVRAVLEPAASRRVELLEREGSPWRLTVRTWAAETPTGGAPAIIAAARAQTPVGIVVDSLIEDGATYDHMTDHHGSYEELAVEFPVYDSAAPDEDTTTYHVPEEGTEA